MTTPYSILDNLSGLVHDVLDTAPMPTEMHIKIKDTIHQLQCSLRGVGVLGPLSSYELEHIRETTARAIQYLNDFEREIHSSREELTAEHRLTCIDGLYDIRDLLFQIDGTPPDELANSDDDLYGAARIRLTKLLHEIHDGCKAGVNLHSFKRVMECFPHYLFVLFAY